jgi:hypothetical protein
MGLLPDELHHAIHQGYDWQRLDDGSIHFYTVAGFLNMRLDSLKTVRTARKARAGLHTIQGKRPAHKLLAPCLFEAIGC